MANADPRKRAGIPIARRRVLVGVVSVAIGIGAMVLLTVGQDRIRTMGQEQACRQGDANACLRLELSYRTGTRVSKDDEVADSFRRQAIEVQRRNCEGRDGQACFQLGVLLSESPAQLRDGPAASAAFARACKSGLERACALAGDP